MKHNSNAVAREIEEIKGKSSIQESLSTSDRLKIGTVVLLVISLSVLIVLKS